MFTPPISRCLCVQTSWLHIRCPPLQHVLIFLIAIALRNVRCLDNAGDSDSCPVGLAGESCRASAGGTQPWKAVEGCAIPAGNDIGEPQLLTVADARARCGALPNCQGFTFEGTDPDGPLSGGPIWVHMKEKFGCISAQWIAYHKLQGVEAPAPPVPPPAPTTTPLPVQALVPGSGDGVALCLSGQVRMLRTTSAVILQNVMQVLKPDVFMYGPLDKSMPDGPELYGLEDYVRTSRWEDEDIRSQLYNETENAARTIDLEYLEIQGNWFGNQCLRPPLRDNRPGSALCMYYNQQTCLNLITDSERERKQLYEWVIISRTDFRWLAPHPPLDLLADEDSVWIPSGSDWEGGINDRHVVMRRRFTEAYLSGWRLIAEGKAKEVMLSTLGSMKVMGYPGPNTENYLKARLSHYKVAVERFPNVAYLTCTQRDKSRWTQCSGTATNDAPGWLYKEEMEHATRVAQCIRSAWSRRKMEECKDDISHLYRGFR